VSTASRYDNVVVRSSTNMYAQAHPVFHRVFLGH